MHAIAIILGDNDFGNTFRPLLDTLATAITAHPDFTPEQVKTLIYLGTTFHYAAFCNRFQYKYAREDSFDEHFEQMGPKLVPRKILFDDEADAAYLSEDHDSGAWHLHIPSGQINSF